MQGVCGCRRRGAMVLAMVCGTSRRFPGLGDPRSPEDRGARAREMPPATCLCTTAALQPSSLSSPSRRTRWQIEAHAVSVAYAEAATARATGRVASAYFICLIEYAYAVASTSLSPELTAYAQERHFRTKSSTGHPPQYVSRSGQLRAWSSVGHPPSLPAIAGWYTTLSSSVTGSSAALARRTSP